MCKVEYGSELQTNLKYVPVDERPDALFTPPKAKRQKTLTCEYCQQAGF